MPRDSGQPGHPLEGHLSAHGQNQSLEQQREAGQSARPRRLDQRHPPVGEPYARHSRLKHTLVLEEVQVPVPLDLGVVHRMRAAGRLVGETTASPEVDPYRQPAVPFVEVHAVNEPRLCHSQCLREQISLHLAPLNQSTISANEPVLPTDRAHRYRSPQIPQTSRRRRLRRTCPIPPSEPARKRRLPTRNSKEAHFTRGSLPRPLKPLSVARRRQTNEHQ